MQFENVHPHPEWKRAFEEIGKILEADLKRDFFAYDELRPIFGLDIRAPRGRKQFDRFNKECRAAWNIHFEVVRTEGYRIVRPQEHSACSLKRLQRGGRQVKRALHIAAHTKKHLLSSEELEKHETIETVLKTASIEMYRAGGKVRLLITGIEQPKLEPKQIEAMSKVS